MRDDVHANLARHESLLDLMTHINRHVDIPSIAAVLAVKIKYVACVFSWRFILREGDDAFVIDAFRGHATTRVTRFDSLSAGERRWWDCSRPERVTGAALAALKPSLPRHLAADSARLIQVLPYHRDGTTRSMFVLSSRCQEFGALDLKFASLIASTFHDKVEATRAQDRFNADLEELVDRRTQDLLAQSRTLQVEIAERTRVEAELRALNCELERRVEERTAELRQSNEELRASKRATETALRAKKEFVARLSHEIRTPMHGVLGMVELMQREPEPTRDTDCLATIERSGRHLLALIDDLLDLAKLEAGRMELDERPVDVR